jgi:hypothetical protein
MLDIVQNSNGEHSFGSPYEAMLRDLNRRGLNSDKFVSPAAPEDLSSRNLFPHEQSREPGFYDATFAKREKVHEAIRLPSYR